MSQSTSLQPAYFDAVYSAKADPWDYEGSEYEREKYAATLEALPAERYASAFEIGCSIGVLTKALALRCDSLLSVDVSNAALATARRRLKGQTHVRIEKMSVPEEFPKQHFNLVMLSEVGYFWSAPDLVSASQQIVDILLPGANLMLVHWTPVVHDYPLTGDAVHDHFLSLAGHAKPLTHLHGFRERTYRLDVFERNRDAGVQRK